MGGLAVDTASAPDRVFQLWCYTVGMGRLLLRSTKTATFRTRIDVLFQNVKAVKLPTRLDGLSVRPASDDELRAIEEDSGLLAAEDTRFFIVEGSGYAGYVVAGVMVTHVDEGEYNEPSALLTGV
jgi:hypothetical protein